VLWFVLTSASGYTQSETELFPEAALIVYRCDFRAETNTAWIHAVLMGANGAPIPRDSYSVSLTETVSGQVLESENVSVSSVADRTPLEMIVVLDITETVPIEEIVSEFSTQLVPQLLVQDEVALITFSQDISPITQFYTDKNRLINEHMLDLQTVDGDNRLYDAIVEAVSAMPFVSDRRQVVLVLTDSGRRETEQASQALIIADALESKIQIYSIGFYSRDRPDDDELQALANGTGGYSWIYNEGEITREAIAKGVGDYLDDFARTLNSEILLSIDMQGQTPDANGRVPFDIVIDTDNDSTLSDHIDCPIQVLHHAIDFAEGTEDATVSEPVELGVTVETDLNPELTQVVFRVNDEIVQSSLDQVYVFDSPGMTPGYYTIGAQLRDQNNELLATTPATIRLFVQQILAFRRGDDAGDLPAGAVRFEVLANPEIELPDIHFTISSDADPGVVHTLGEGPVPLDEAGGAVLTIPDMTTTVITLFPQITETHTVQISAFVPGVSPGDPPLAISEILTIQPELPSQAPIPIRFDYLRESIPLTLTVFFLLLNYLLLRQVGRLRIKRLINNPDDYELSNQLMSITVRQRGFDQSHTLTKKTLTVGRGSSNDINLGDDPSVSRQHGVVMWRNQQWYYSNRKRGISARINGKRYSGLKLGKLEAITELEVGNAQLVFHSNTQRDISEFVRTNL
jgi:hypothetical protein